MNGTMTGYLRAATAAATLAAVSGAAHAQQPPQRRPERAARLLDPTWRLRVDTELSLAERTQVEYGGAFTFTGLWLDDATDDSLRLFQYDTSLFARASIDGVHNAFVRARFAYRDFSQGDSFDGRGDQWLEPFLDRYWYELDLGAAQRAYSAVEPDVDVRLRVGRQFVDWGSGLALSEAILGGVLDAKAGPWALRAIAGVTPSDESVIDFDASRADYDSNTVRGYFGAELSYQLRDATRFYVFGLHMPDYNTSMRPRVDILTLGQVNFSYTATYFGVGGTGSIGPNLVWSAEGVYEIGEDMSDPLRGPQTEERISAAAARLQLSYLLRDENYTQLELEMIFATGDDDRLSSTDTVGGNLSGTTDTGFNSLGYVNTGLAFAPSLSNLFSTRLGASTFPLRNTRWAKQMQVGADFYLFNKLDPDGPIDEPTTNDLFLGVETDVYMNWRITSDVAFTARYGAFFPGDAIAGETDVRHFALFGVTLSF